MKKLFYTLLTVFLIQYSYAQKGEGNFIDKAVNLIEQEVNRIEKDICFTTQVDCRGYFLSDTIDINEWLSILYFDKNGRILKSRTLYSYPEGDGFYCRYYNNDGVAIHSLYSSSSGMSNSFSVSRYLNTDKSLLYIDFLRLDEDNGGVIIEHTCRSGYYNLPMPKEYGEIYDKVMDFKDLKSELNKVFKIDSLYMPQEVSTVKFILPRKGDQTFITHNSVPIYKDASKVYSPIKELNVGAKVQVLDIDENWYRIKYIKWEGMEAVETIGYVEQKFLAHVEIKQ